MVGPLVEGTFEGSTCSDYNTFTLMLYETKRFIFMRRLLCFSFLEAYCGYMVYDAVGDRQEAFH